MEPHDVLLTDRSTFESELDGLIGAAAQSSTRATSSPSRESSTIEGTPSKRLKTRHDSTGALVLDDYPLHVHPSRRVLLDRPRSLEAPSSPTTSPVAQGMDTGWLTFSDEPHQHSHYVTTSTLQSNEHSSAPPTGPKAWNNLKKTIRRQWDPSDDDLAYEQLLEQRRNEKLNSVDRYVPSIDKDRGVPREVNMRTQQRSRTRTAFPFERLPEDVKEKIFALLLVKADPIQIDFYWLRPFVNGHARVPVVIQRLHHEGSTYFLPVAWNKLLADVGKLKDDMHQFSAALEQRGMKTKWARCPSRGLTTTLLRVSKSIHNSAAKIFYGENTFRFPCSSSAWMLLDAFLATVGSKNSALISKICIHAPLWHRGIEEDYVEGAIVDLLSPASRMAVIKPVARDRLFSAVKGSVRALLDADNLTSLHLELQYGLEADYWSGSHINNKRLIGVSNAGEHVERKTKGMALLRQLADALAAKNNRPTLSLYRPSKQAPLDKREFRKQLPSLITEAQEYGWVVDQYMKT